MNANDLTFGIEFETTIPIGAVPVGSYTNGAQVPGLPVGWVAKSDGSIHAGRGRQGCEFVSPVLRGSDGVKQVLQVLVALNAMGAKVNSSTGLHVHVGWSADEQALARLLSIVSNSETAIFASTGTKAREQGHWCRGVRRYGSKEQAMTTARTSRYHVLNVTNLGAGRKQTVEFRAFAGTLNAAKVLGYIRLCLGLVEQALKANRTPDWVPRPIKPTNSAARKGPGQTAIARLFYQLGWVKGRTKHVFGEVTCDGAPELKTIRKEFMRLAKKYDNA